MIMIYSDEISIFKLCFLLKKGVKLIRKKTILKYDCNLMVKRKYNEENKEFKDNTTTIL